MEVKNVSSLKALGVVGTGGIGVLSTGFIVSSMLKTGSEGVFGLALIIFVTAGAVSLIARSL